MFSAVRACLGDQSLTRSLSANLVAGLTVGVVALPLSMGLAIASGVPPQHGLYTAIVGGIVIALAGGSRVNVSGPTAAFVVVLLPIVHDFGLGGLLLAGALAGLMLIAFGLLRLGRLIQLVPYPVIVGFTTGIGTVIAVLQCKDLFGLQPVGDNLHFIDKLTALVRAAATAQWQEALLGGLTLGVLILWRRLPTRIPGFLVALVLASLLGIAMNAIDAIPDVETIASRFSYDLNGQTGAGIPPALPAFALPWQLPGPDGAPIGLSLHMLRTLLTAAFSIAVLGALESLLCAVVADGMSGFRHDPDGELIGQGLGNLAVAFFGGIPATAAIARTATNVRSGGTTPLAAVTHGVVVLLAMLLLAPLLGRVPMAAMAAVLLMVAWNMSEAPHAWRIVTRAPRADAAVFFCCFALTVVIDMQVAVAAGLALASVLFIRRMIELTETTATHAEHPHPRARQPGVVVYDVDGPLFFGAAHKALKVLASIERDVHTVVLDFEDVPMMDATAMMNLESIVNELSGRSVRVAIVHIHPRLIAKLTRFGLVGPDQPLQIAADVDAVEQAAVASDHSRVG